MADRSAAQIIDDWPKESREAAQLVLDRYGEPQETSESQLTWLEPGPWKRIVATKAFYKHNFPAPHIDSVESVLNYQVPVEKVSELASFDGSVIVERTAGELSARCHDEEANFLALNLAHDIVTGARNVGDARDYYAKEFVDFRRKKPTPYMKGLRFTPADGDSGDPDKRLLSDEELSQAREEGRRAS